MEKRIGSGAPWESQVGYSRAVRKQNMIWVAGTTSVTGDATPYPNDPYRQCRHILQLIQATLSECGASLQDVVRTRIYVTDMKHWEAVGKAHSEFFGDIRPAATMVQVQALIRSELLVEIEADACIAKKKD